MLYLMETVERVQGAWCPWRSHAAAPASTLEAISGRRSSPSSSLYDGLTVQVGNAVLVSQVSHLFHTLLAIFYTSGALRIFSSLLIFSHCTGHWCKELLDTLVKEAIAQRARVL